MAALAGVAGLSAAMGLPREANALDWSSLMGGKREGGTGRVKRLEGVAFSNTRALRENDEVQHGDQIRVPKGSTLVLSLSDDTIFRLVGEAVLNLDIGTRKSGILSLVRGAMLTVMPPGNRYLVQTSTATIGVKGTVFFNQTFAPGERTATNWDDRQIAIPEGATNYVCLCVGEIDYLLPGAAEPFMEGSSSFHNAYYVNEANANPLVRAPLINHRDSDIAMLIDLQDGPKHESDWLPEYNRSYLTRPWSPDSKDLPTTVKRITPGV